QHPPTRRPIRRPSGAPPCKRRAARPVIPSGREPMTAPPLTRASLLVRLRDPNDADAWTEFVRLYAAVIYGFARKRGLQDADAADLMQEVLRSVAGAVGRLEYDPGRGTFRGWLFTVTRNKVFNFMEGRSRHVQGSGDARVQQRLEQHAEEDGT